MVTRLLVTAVNTLLRAIQRGTLLGGSICVFGVLFSCLAYVALTVHKSGDGAAWATAPHVVTPPVALPAAGPPASTANDPVLIKAGSEWHYVVVQGRVSWLELSDSARALAAAGCAVKVGALPSGTAPDSGQAVPRTACAPYPPRNAPRLQALENWALDDATFRNARVGRGPFAFGPVGLRSSAQRVSNARHRDDLSTSGAPEPMAEGTLLPLATGDRVWGLALTTMFTLQGAPVATLALHVRYGDALQIAINGHVVVRRHWLASGETAARPHGPEWETIHLAPAPGLLLPGRNRIAVLLAPHVRRQSPRFDLELRAVPSVRIARGPVVGQVRATQASIWVETTAVATAQLRWQAADPAMRNGSTGAGAAAAWTELTLPAGLRHVFSLTALPPHQRINYVVTAGAESLTGHFFTAPAPTQPVRLAVYGDVRQGHDTHARLLEAMEREAPDAIVATGDMVMRGADEADWQRFFAVVAPVVAHIPMYPALGNHDLGRTGPNLRTAFELFDLPLPEGAAEGQGPAQRASWYTWQLAGVQIVFLDSNRYDDAAQLQWLEATLQHARTQRVRAIIAVTHAGPYSRGIHRGAAIARNRYVPLLVQYGVDVLLSGHDHQYQRGEVEGLRYIVSGGGGAPLYPITCGTASTSACQTPDGMLEVAKAFHFVLLTIEDDTLTACPRRLDGGPLFPCSRWLLQRR